MDNKYFLSVTISDLADIIRATKSSLYLCMPSIHQEIAKAIIELEHNPVPDHPIKIEVLIDFDSQTIRQGYGNIDAIGELHAKDIKMSSLNDNRISFIISDNIGFYLFVESRSLIPADKSTLNAVKMDPVAVVHLIHYFYSDLSKDEFRNQLANAVIEESGELQKITHLDLFESHALSKVIPDKLLTEVQDDLKRNPPLNPDYKRIVEYYTNKFQYAELHFEGQNIQHATISLPSKILPYRNEEIRNKMKTKLKLFENLEMSSDFQNFKEIELKKKTISEHYLTPLKCRPNKNVLKKVDKEAFKEEISILKQDLEKRRKELYNVMLHEIDKSINSLIENLFQFLLDNPTEDMITMGKDNHARIAANIAKNLVNKINIPDPAKFIAKFSIKLVFCDLTYEDLSDQELITEFMERGLLETNDETELAIFGKGIVLI